MSYEDDAKQAEEAGHAKAVSAPIYKFEEVGQSVLGIITSVKEIRSDETDDTFSVYAMKTDAGIIQFAAGMVLANIVAEALLMNRLIRITYEGQADTRKGNRVNQYTVIDYTTGDSIEIAEDIE